MVKEANEPFIFVEKPVIHRNVRENPICRATLLKYLHLLTGCVERKIRSMLPDKIAIVFDGWSNGYYHYVGTFASFTTNLAAGYRAVLLGISMMENEETQNAEDHIRYIEYLLET